MNKPTIKILPARVSCEMRRRSELGRHALLWTILGMLAVMALSSTFWLVHRVWPYPVTWLIRPSSTLALTPMILQVQTVSTALVAILAGGLLGVVSVLLQQLVKNTLASDTTLAIGGGAQLGLLLASLYMPSAVVYGSFGVAFVGALVGMGLVFVLSAPSRMDPVVLVLSGLVVNIVFAAISGLLLLFYSQKALGVLAWSSGFLTQSSWSTPKVLGCVALALPCALMVLIKPLTLMSLDDRQARSLGAPVNVIRAIVVVLAACVTAAVVSRVGLMGFTGLAAASLVNAFAVRAMAFRLIWGFVLGALILWITSNAIALIDSLFQLTIPVGAITAILGSPLMIGLVMLQRRSSLGEAVSGSGQFVKGKKILWPAWLLGLACLVMVVLIVAPNAEGWKNWRMQDWAFIMHYRLPRTLSALATGAMLAVAGGLLQALTRNHMASPEVLGISSGAALGVVLSFVAMPFLGKVLALSSAALLNWNMATMLLSGFCGAMIALSMVMLLARKLSTMHLLLVGVAIEALMVGILTVIKSSGDPRLQAILYWLSGTTYNARPATAWWLVGIALGLCGLSFLFVKPLKILLLGPVIAQNLGVAVKRNNILVMGLVALLSTASTLAVGPLSFVGLMMPHLAAMLGAASLSRQLFLAAILGAYLMVVADWLGRYIIFPYEIPAGTIAAVIGGVYFVGMMRQIGNQQ